LNVIIQNLIRPAALTLCVALLAQAPQTQEIRIRADAPSHAFPHFWEQMYGSGRAVLSLRDDYRRDLRKMKKTTGIEYVRFHAIFHDEIGVYNQDAQGKPFYNYSYVDRIYDGLLAAGVKPFVELSFMPRQLAASDQPHAFWYKPRVSPPKDYAKWDDLIYHFTQHLVERYGIEEAAQWYFEVWNEPNIDFWIGEPKQSTYFTLYDHTARAVKRANARLRVGGPATAQAAWIEPMIQHCISGNVPLDFVSTHVYGNDSAKDVFGTDDKIPRPDMVARSVRKVYDEVKRSQRPDLPIIWSEYNASYSNEVEVTDSAYMGPWLANNIRLCDGLTTMMSYWTFSDVFEEQGIVKTPFYGGYGLIAEGGVPKAALNAFAMLHRLGKQRLQLNEDDVLATKRGDGTMAVAIWNYAPPGERGIARQVHITVDGLPASAQFRSEIVDPQHGSALEAWQAMGSPAFPTVQQYRALREAATKTMHVEGASLTLPAHGLALMEISAR
jgi:xylan 1,4-beta-xylosidase